MFKVSKKIKKEENLLKRQTTRFKKGKFFKHILKKIYQAGTY